MTVVLAAGAIWSLGLFCVAWALRSVAALIVDHALATLWQRTLVPDAARQPVGTKACGKSDAAALAFRCPVWLLPLRDIMSVAVMLASYGGRQVDWRGHGLLADRPPPFINQSATPRP
jgi:hypothetical protein